MASKKTMVTDPNQLVGKTFNKYPTQEMLNIPFKGVCALASRRSNGNYTLTGFRVRLSGNGRKVYAGSAVLVEDAAKMYNNTAKKMFGSEKNAKKSNKWNVLVK